MWEARDPVGVDNFPLPAEVGVIGHHTHWDECFTLQECIKVSFTTEKRLYYETQMLNIFKKANLASFASSRDKP